MLSSSTLEPYLLRGTRPASEPVSGKYNVASYRSLAIRCRWLCRALCKALWLPQGPSSTKEGKETTPAMRCSKASSQLVIRTNAGVKVTSALGVFVLPFGRPGRRFAHGALDFLAAALALLAACSASLRTTCSTRIGNERRAWPLTSDRVKKAHPGTGLPYRLAKNRSRPWVCLPALVATTSSPTSREVSSGRDTWCRKNPQNRGAHGTTVEKKRCTGRNLPPLAAQPDRPNMVTRPVLTTMAAVIRWKWRRVVAVT